MKILVTGHNGYIGSYLYPLLKEEGYEVIGVDLNIFENCNWESLVKPDKELTKDFRELTLKELDGIDCIIHLAAISNDPMGDLVENLTYNINLYGTVNLAKKAKEAGVPRFLVSSSCSVYGKGKKLDLDENAYLNPVSAYAISKVKADIEIGKLADNFFTPAYLRNSTAYGHSAMLRIDLVVNNLLACAFTQGIIKIMSDGTPWRPLIHAKDIARAFVQFTKAPKEKIHNKAINIGSNEENYQVRDIADKVKRYIPNAEIVFAKDAKEDPRSYRVNFDLLKNTFPEFKLEYTLDKGMEELYNKFKEHKFNSDDFNGDKFVRLRTLKKRLSKIKDEVEASILL